MAPSSAFPFPANADDEEQLWRQRVGALQAAPRLMREMGVDPTPALAAAGLHESAFDLADNSIPYAAFGRFVHGAAQHTGCEHFGLLVGQAWTLPHLGLPGQLMRHAATLRDALNDLCVYHHLNSQGGVVFLREHGAVTEIGYLIYQRGIVGARQIYDGVTAVQVKIMRELCGPGWVPSEVLLAHAAPADASPYRALFRCPVRFNAEHSALRFASAWLDRPLVGADPAERRRLLALARESSRPDLIDLLRRSLRVQLVHRVASGNAVADLLAMHRRTLNRHLQALGTTFRDVLEDVRYEAACQLLDSTELPLDDIADALGYAGVSPFTRAFRRRAGMPPGQWRRHANASSAEKPALADALPTSRAQLDISSCPDPARPAA
jgi:AraC-like DNA-binding protein